MSLGYGAIEGKPLDYRKSVSAGPSGQAYVDLHTGLWHADEKTLWEESRPAGGALVLSPEALAVHALAHCILGKGCLERKARLDFFAIAGGGAFDREHFCGHVRRLSLEPLAFAALEELARESPLARDLLPGCRPRGLKRLLLPVFRLGCSYRPNALLEYLLPALLRPRLAWEALFPSAEQLELRRGDSSPGARLARFGELVFNFFRKIAGKKSGQRVSS